jgi:long-chain acyl-CoA synthetase
MQVRLRSVPNMGYTVSGPGPARGELCLRGPCLFSGYYRQPEETAQVVMSSLLHMRAPCHRPQQLPEARPRPQVMDSDGFLLTGDVAELAPCGALRIIDRRRQLVKLAQGEYVSPARVEAAVRGCAGGLVEAAWVHGEPGERRLVAVVVPKEVAWVARAPGSIPGMHQICAGGRRPAVGWLAHV